MQFADEHPGLRAWAIEGTGGYGAGLARHLARGGEFVAGLDRPERARRRNGAKSDPLDAIRAAREALSRTRLGTPRTTGERQALSVLLAARRSAAEASRIAQQQVFSLVIAAPEQLRPKFRGKSTLAMARTASRLRLRAEQDLETRTTAARVRHGGKLPPRGRSISSDKLEAAQQLYQRGDMPARRIAAAVGISRASLYRALPPGGRANSASPSVTRAG